jgi:enamine deaminase RidA (YjgF/YER057c/UK114 family)
VAQAKPEVERVERRQVNPWTWQDRAGFSQAWRIDGAASTVYVSGQAAISAEGELVGEGDFEAQVRQTFANLATVLEQAGASIENVVKVGVFLTEIANLPVYGRLKAELFSGPQPASTAVEVSSLALPGMMIEVEAFAVL